MRGAEQNRLLGLGRGIQRANCHARVKNADRGGLSEKIAKSFSRPIFPMRCRKQSLTEETSGETAPKTRLSKNTNNLRRYIDRGRRVTLARAVCRDIKKLRRRGEGWARKEGRVREEKGEANQSLQGMPEIRSGLGFIAEVETVHSLLRHLSHSPFAIAPMLIPILEQRFVFHHSPWRV